MIYEDFRSQVIIDAAQNFMSHLQAEVKAKEIQMKKAEEAKGGATLIEQNQKRGLEDKLKAKDVEITHLKSSIGELTTGIRELQKLAADELESAREAAATEKKALTDELQKIKSEHSKHIEDKSVLQRNLLSKKSLEETEQVLLEKEVEHLKALI